MQSKTRYVSEATAITVLRVVAGVIMTAHGWNKLTDVQGTQQAFTAMGVPAPEVSVYLAIAGEFLGGLGLILGLLTPLAALGVACVMVSAIGIVHLPNGLFAENNGFEYPLTMLAVSLFLIARGAGPVSLDAVIVRSRRKRRQDISAEGRLPESRKPHGAERRRRQQRAPGGPEARM